MMVSRGLKKCTTLWKPIITIPNSSACGVFSCRWPCRPKAGNKRPRFRDVVKSSICPRGVAAVFVEKCSRFACFWQARRATIGLHIFYILILINTTLKIRNYTELMSYLQWHKLFELSYHLKTFDLFYLFKYKLNLPVEKWNVKNKFRYR